MNLSPELSALTEKLRGDLAGIYRRRRVVSCCVFCGILSEVVGFLTAIRQEEPLGFFIGVGIGAVLLGAAHLLWKQISQIFKESIVGAVIREIHPSLRYTPDCGLSVNEFNRCGLFLTRPNRFSTEDQVQGVIGKTAVCFSECDAKKVTGSGKHRHVVQIFRGVIFKADFPKKFSCSAVVLPDCAEAVFGNLVGGFLQKCNFVRGERIKLEDPEFERLFAVYGNDQQEVRYLLSPSFMTRLVALKKSRRCQVMCSFQQGEFYLALGGFRNVFELPLFSKPAPEAMLQRIAQDLQDLTGIVDELDLNTRIWSKPEGAVRT